MCIYLFKKFTDVQNMQTYTSCTIYDTLTNVWCSSYPTNSIKNMEISAQMQTGENHRMDKIFLIHWILREERQTLHDLLSRQYLICSEMQMICIWSSWCHGHPIIACFIKIQNSLTFLVLAFPGCPGKEAVKWVCLFHPKCSILYITDLQYNTVVSTGFQLTRLTRNN